MNLPTAIVVVVSIVAGVSLVGIVVHALFMRSILNRMRERREIDT